MQCDKVEKFLKKLRFVKGTDSKSANLPQIFQSAASLENLHSHTASVAIAPTHTCTILIFLFAIVALVNPHHAKGKPQ